MSMRLSALYFISYALENIKHGLFHVIECTYNLQKGYTVGRKNLIEKKTDEPLVDYCATDESVKINLKKIICLQKY